MVTIFNEIKMKRSLTKYIKPALCLIVLLQIISCDKKTDPVAEDVIAKSDKLKPFAVTVDGIALSDTEMEYRIVVLSHAGEPVIIKKFKDIVDIIWGSEKEFAYLDQQGNVWEVALSDLSPNLLLNIGYLPKEDAVGNFILNYSDKKLYYIINSYPPSSDPIFSFNLVPFNGKRQTLFSGRGKAIAIKQLSGNIFRIITSINTFDIDITTGKTTEPERDKEDSRVVFYSSNYFVTQKHDVSGYAAEVFRNTKTDNPVLKYKMNRESGFGLAVDLDENRKELLLIEVAPPDTPSNRLVTVNFGGIVKEIYKSTLIGSARFLR